MLHYLFYRKCSNQRFWYLRLICCSSRTISNLVIKCGLAFIVKKEESALFWVKYLLSIWRNDRFYVLLKNYIITHVPPGIT